MAMHKHEEGAKGEGLRRMILYKFIHLGARIGLSTVTIRLLVRYSVLADDLRRFVVKFVDRTW